MFYRSLVVISLMASIFSFGRAGAAEGPPAVARVFIGAVNPDFTNLNTKMTGLGLESFDKSLPMFGAEAVASLGFIELGINYSKRANVRKEASASGNDYQAKLDQDVAILIARLPVLKTSVIRVDAFGGFGGSNTTLDIKSATETGEVAKKDKGSFFASPVTRYGASAGIGWRGVYLTLESGIETNKVEGLESTGTVTGITAIDFSGQYLTLGITIDGAKITKK